MARRDLRLGSDAAGESERVSRRLPCARGRALVRAPVRERERAGGVDKLPLCNHEHPYRICAHALSHSHFDICP